MINFLKKLWYKIVPQEKSRKANDIGYIATATNGRQYRVYAPTVSVSPKDDYHKKPIELPATMQKITRGYHYNDRERKTRRKRTHNNNGRGC